MQKRMSILLILVLSFPIGCVSRFNIIKSELTDDYTKKAYGERYDRGAYFLSQNEFTYFMNKHKTSIMEDSSIPDNQKEKYVEDIDKVKYEENQFVVFYVSLNKPLLKRDTAFRFQIIDSEKKELIDKILFIPMKLTTFYQGGGSYSSYSYIWIIKTKDQVTKKNIGRDRMPIVLNVEYPHNKNEVFSILE